MKKHLIALLFLLFPSYVHAYSDFTPSDLSAVTGDMVDSLLETIAVGAAERTYQPASNLGILGFDIGVEVTAISLPSEFQNALALASQVSQTQIPGLFPLPRLNARVGLPFGIDFGATYTGYEDIFQSIGLDAKWTFMKVSGLADLATQVTGNYTKIWYISTHAYTFDVVMSKNLILLEPYIGAGLVNWNGDLDVPLGGSKGLPTDIAAHDSGTTGHFFVGVPIKLLLLHLTPQYDYGFSGVSTYGIKVSLAF